MEKGNSIYNGPEEMKVYVCQKLYWIVCSNKAKLGQFFGVSPRTIGRWTHLTLQVDYCYDFSDSDCIEFFLDNRTPNSEFLITSDENGTFFMVDNCTISQSVEISDADEKEEIVNIQFIILPQTVVVVRDGTPLSVDSGHRYFNKIKDLIQDNYKIVNNNASILKNVLDDIYKFIDLKTGIEEYSNGKVKVTKNGVEFAGEIINNTLSDRILNVLENNDGETDTLESLTNFLQLVKENPSYKAVERLYDFLVANDISIDKDGYVLTYRTNTADYKDKYTRKFDNTPGSHLEMSRNMVNDDDNQTCSNGFHVCSIHYILRGGYYTSGDRLTLNRVHPKDFVSFPVDYNDSKARVCAYDVVSDVTDKLVKKYNL